MRLTEEKDGKKTGNVSIRVQYKKVTLYRQRIPFIQHADLMSNVERGMSNYEVLSLYELAARKYDFLFLFSAITLLAEEHVSQT